MKKILLFALLLNAIAVNVHAQKSCKYYYNDIRTAENLAEDLNGEAVKVTVRSYY